MPRRVVKRRPKKAEEGEEAGDRFEYVKEKPAKGRATVHSKRPAKKRPSSDDDIGEDEADDYEEDELHIDPKSGKKKRKVNWLPIFFLLLMVCAMFTLSSRH